MTAKTIEKNIEEIPKFISLRGCINCDISKKHKEETGCEYGFDHEKVAGCIISGCVNYGFDLSSPFIDPEEIIKIAKESKNAEYMKNARNYLLKVKEKFGQFYNRMGINLEDFAK
jgi:hypothetical protein